MLSIFRSLFRLGNKGAGETAAAGKRAEHKGFIIEATPYRQGSGYQTAGVIHKDIDGIRKEYKFVRADCFTTLDDAVDFALSKGRQIIDEQGDGMFERRGEP